MKRKFNNSATRTKQDEKDELIGAFIAIGGVLIGIIVFIYHII